MITHANKQLLTVESPLPESQIVCGSIEALAHSRGTLSILEAGCGNSWQVQLRGVSFELTGVDINGPALVARQRLHGDLDHCIQGDLRTVDLEANKYDVIYNSFVLEHVEQAEVVLDNFFRWLSPGGLLVLRIPDPRSAYGFLARLTPFWVHVFYKRYIAGVKTAGQPGFDPFPTIYDPVVSRSGIHDWCASRGVTIREELGWNYQFVRPGVLSVLVHAGIRALGWLSCGRLSTDHVNLTYVIEKPVEALATVGSREAQLHTEVLP